MKEIVWFGLVQNGDMVDELSIVDASIRQAMCSYRRNEMLF